MKKTLTCLLVALISLASNAQMKKMNVSNIKNKYSDIPYSTISKAQKLDIYLPDECNGPFPVILSIHGGAFKMGDKRDEQLTPMLEGLNRGYAVVSINYRLSGEAIWPAQINDCKAAVRWLRANSAKYKLNPDKIAAWGGSAGGHLSAMLGTSGDVKDLDDLTLGNPAQSSRVQAVVDWFGPTNFLKMDEQLRESGVENPQSHSVPDSPESELIGKNLEDAPQLVNESNPETYVSSDDPPFFIQHGLEDNLVPYQGSVLLARKLGKMLGYKKVSLELFSATRHGGEAFGTEENLNKVFTFLDKYLQGDKADRSATANKTTIP
jgi:acetyl esterase/lipase